MHDRSSHSRLGSSLANKRRWADPGTGVLAPCHNPTPVDNAHVQSNEQESYGIWGAVCTIYRLLKNWVSWIDTEPLSEESYEDEKAWVGSQIERLGREHGTLRTMLDEDRARCGDLMRRIMELRQAEYMREQDRFQMEVLMEDKARLMAENSTLGRELKGLQDVLEYTIECFADENTERINLPGPAVELRGKSS